MSVFFKGAFTFLFIQFLAIQNTNGEVEVEKRSVLEKILTPKACPTGFTGDSCEIECGLTYFNQNQKIVGGSVANANSWPSAVYVLFTYGGNFYLADWGVNVYKTVSYVCGGTLIDKNTVVTAAHCVYSSISFTYLGYTYTVPVRSNQYYPTNASLFTVYLGLQDSSLIFSSTANISPAVKMNVSSVILHENFNPNTYQNNIAILKLSTPATLNNYIQVACLPTASSVTYPTPNKAAWAVGWGTISASSSYPSSSLRNVKLTVYDGSKCNSVYTSVAKNWTNQICCGHLAGGRDTCKGDGGGPLYVLDTINGKSKYVFAGIISYGYSCALPNYPGIYTRVSSYLDWISAKRVGNSSSTLTTVPLTQPQTTLKMTTATKTAQRVTSTSTTTRAASTLAPTTIKSTTTNSSIKSCPEGFTGDNCEIECGVSYFTQNQKIVGGSVAVAGSWPAQAFIEACYGGNFYLAKFGVTVYRSQCFVCGGTLIDKTTVLTAAHCMLDSIDFTYNGASFTVPTYANSFYPTNGSMYTIYLGLQDKSTLSNSNISPAVKMSVSRVAIHKDYDSENIVNDIAILKLSSAVTLSQNIQVACLPQAQSAFYPPINQPAWIVGWGTTSEGGSVSKILKNARITVYDPTVYCKAYSSQGGVTNWATQICAGNYTGGTDTCQGDSGGPMYVLSTIGGKTKYVLSGVTSYGNGCATAGFPGIYTRVSNFLSWIAANK